MTENTNHNSLSFFVLTDIHYYSKKIGTSGRAYSEMATYNQKLHAHTKELLQEVFNKLIQEKDTNIVLIHGDLTNNGEVVSHEEFRQMLYLLQEKGKKIFLTYSTHDYKKTLNVTKGYEGDRIIEIPSFTLNDIKDYYNDFGKNKAISFHQPTGSYAAQLNENIRLLALNDDFGYQRNGFTDETMDWIRAQVSKAKQDNNYIFVMAHHPIMAASPLYGIFGKKDMIESAEQRINEFADMGVNLYFSGHSHMQKIDYNISPHGNLLYNISTSALTGYPPVYRKVLIDLQSKQVKIKSHIVKHAKGIDTDKKLDEHLRQKFLGMIGDFIYAGKDKNMDRVKEMAKGISMKPEQIDSKKWLIVPFSKWLYKLSYKKVMKYTKRETGLNPKDYESVQDKKALPIIINLIANIYDGNPSYTPDTLEFKLIMGLMAIVDSVIRHVPVNLYKKTGYKTLSEIVQPMVYNSGLNNYDITLQLSPKKAELPPKQKYQPPYKSKKGFFIVYGLIVLGLILSPILLPAGLIFFIANKIKSSFKKKD